MSDLKYLKITQKGFEKYNGPLSVYEFEDGMSVEPIPRTERDRIAATMNCVEVAENGKEISAGVADRLVAESKMRAPREKALKRQSVENKVAEEKAAAEKAIGELKKIYSEEELDEIIEDGGIAALRRVAEPWGVKNRSLVVLRQMILDEQKEYTAEHGRKLEKSKAAVEKVVRDTQAANTEPKKTEDIVEDEVLKAAESGDMSAAISDEDDNSKE